MIHGADHLLDRVPKGHDECDTDLKRKPLTMTTRGFRKCLSFGIKITIVVIPLVSPMPNDRNRIGESGPQPSFLALVLIFSLVFMGGPQLSSLSLGQEPRATPYRPTLSNPAQLPVPGYVEMEMGWQSLKDKAADDYRHSVPYLFKMAFTDRIGILISGEAVIINDFEQSPTLAGFGDLTPLLKINVPLTQIPSALGMEVGAKLPTAPETVGSGQTDYLVTGIYSGVIGPLGIDLNLGYTRFGRTSRAPLSEEGRDQLFWAASTAYGLTDEWSVAGELAGTMRKNVKPFTQVLTSSSYFFSPRLVGDLGAAFGLNGASQEWTVFSGMTILLGKVWNAK